MNNHLCMPMLRIGHCQVIEQVTNILPCTYMYMYIRNFVFYFILAKKLQNFDSKIHTLTHVPLWPDVGQR